MSEWKNPDHSDYYDARNQVEGYGDGGGSGYGNGDGEGGGAPYSCGDNWLYDAKLGHGLGDGPGSWQPECHSVGEGDGYGDGRGRDHYWSPMTKNPIKQNEAGRDYENGGQDQVRAVKPPSRFKWPPDL